MAGPQLGPPGSRRYRWYGLIPMPQDNFAAGMFPSQENMPANGAEDIVNGLIQDDGSILKRGGCTDVSGSSYAIAQRQIWDGYLPGGARTVTGGETNANTRAQYGVGGPASGKIYAFVDGAIVEMATSTTDIPNVWTPWVESSGFLFMPSRYTTAMWAYGGVPATGNVSITVSVTAGSRTVTTSGNFISSGVKAGHILPAGAFVRGVVASVESATSLTLAYEWGGITQTFAGVFNAVTTDTLESLQPQARAGVTPSSVGSAGTRLYVAQDNRIFFSNRRQPFVYSKDDYHALPLGAKVLGLYGVGANLLVFSTAGLWMVTNTALDLTDASGNAQQQLRQVDDELILWDANGIIGHQGRLIVPTTRGPFLVDGVSAPTPIAAGILPLWQSYVAGGYRLGRASVYRDHYLLPVSNGTLLVLRTDMNAWTRFTGTAAAGGTFLHVLDAAGSRSPSVYAISSGGVRLIDLGPCWTPSAANKNDYDATTPNLQITTRTLSMGTMVANTFKKVRLRFELDDAAADNPTITAEIATGRPGDSFSSLSGSAPKGETTFAWVFAKRARNARFRFTSVGPAAKLVIRGFEAFARQSGHS